MLQNFKIIIGLSNGKSITSRYGFVRHMDFPINLFNLKSFSAVFSKINCVFD